MAEPRALNPYNQTPVPGARQPISRPNNRPSAQGPSSATPPFTNPLDVYTPSTSIPENSAPNLPTDIVDLSYVSYPQDNTGSYGSDAFIGITQSGLMNGQNVRWLLVNFSGLKWINDHWGHQAGNSYLLRVKAILEEVIGSPVQIVRQGPNFAVLLPENVDAAAVMQSLEGNLHSGVDFTYLRHHRDGRVEIIPASYSTATEGRSRIFNQELLVYDATQQYSFEAIFAGLRKESYHLNRPEMEGARYASPQIIGNGYRMVILDSQRLSTLNLEDRLIGREVPAARDGMIVSLTEPRSGAENVRALEGDALNLLLDGGRMELSVIDLNAIGAFRSLGPLGDLMIDAVLEVRVIEAAQVLDGTGITLYRHGGGSEEYYLAGDVSEEQMANATRLFLEALNAEPLVLRVEVSDLESTAMGRQTLEYLRQTGQYQPYQYTFENGQSSQMVDVDLTRVIRGIPQTDGTWKTFIGLTGTAAIGEITRPAEGESIEVRPRFRDHRFGRILEVFARGRDGIMELVEKAKPNNPNRDNLVVKAGRYRSTETLFRDGAEGVSPDNVLALISHFRSGIPTGVVELYADQNGRISFERGSGQSYPIRITIIDGPHGVPYLESLEVSDELRRESPRTIDILTGSLARINRALLQNVVSWLGNSRQRRGYQLAEVASELNQFTREHPVEIAVSPSSPAPVEDTLPRPVNPSPWGEEAMMASGGTQRGGPYYHSGSPDGVVPPAAATVSAPNPIQTPVVPGRDPADYQVAEQETVGIEQDAVQQGGASGEQGQTYTVTRGLGESSDFTKGTRFGEILTRVQQRIAALPPGETLHILTIGPGNGNMEAELKQALETMGLKDRVTIDTFALTSEISPENRQYIQDEYLGNIDYNQLPHGRGGTGYDLILSINGTVWAQDQAFAAQQAYDALATGGEASITVQKRRPFAQQVNRLAATVTGWEIFEQQGLLLSIDPLSDVSSQLYMQRTGTQSFDFSQLPAPQSGYAYHYQATRNGEWMEVPLPQLKQIIADSMRAAGFDPNNSSHYSDVLTAVVEHHMPVDEAIASFANIGTPINASSATSPVPDVADPLLSFLKRQGAGLSAGIVSLRIVGGELEIVGPGAQADFLLSVNSNGKATHIFIMNPQYDQAEFDLNEAIQEYNTTLGTATAEHAGLPPAEPVALVMPEGFEDIKYRIGNEAAEMLAPFLAGREEINVRGLIRALRKFRDSGEITGELAELEMPAEQLQQLRTKLIEVHGEYVRGRVYRFGQIEAAVNGGEPMDQATVEAYLETLRRIAAQPNLVALMGADRLAKLQTKLVAKLSAAAEPAAPIANPIVEVLMNEYHLSAAEVGQVMRLFTEQGLNEQEFMSKLEEIAPDLAANFNQLKAKLNQAMLADLSARAANDPELSARLQEQFRAGGGRLGVGAVFSEIGQECFQEYSQNGIAAALGSNSPALQFLLEPVVEGEFWTSLARGQFDALKEFFSTAMPATGAGIVGANIYNMLLNLFGVSQDSNARGVLPQVTVGVLSAMGYSTLAGGGASSALGRTLSRLLSNPVTQRVFVALALNAPITDGVSRLFGTTDDFEVGARIAQREHPTAFGALSILGQEYATMIINTFDTDAIYNYEMGLIDQSVAAEITGQNILDALSAMTLLYVARNPIFLNPELYGGQPIIEVAENPELADPSYYLRLTGQYEVALTGQEADLGAVIGEENGELFDSTPRANPAELAYAMLVGIHQGQDLSAQMPAFRALGMMDENGNVNHSNQYVKEGQRLFDERSRHIEQQGLVAEVGRLVDGQMAEALSSIQATNNEIDAAHATGLAPSVEVNLPHQLLGNSRGNIDETALMNYIFAENEEAIWDISHEQRVAYFTVQQIAHALAGEAVDIDFSDPMVQAALKYLKSRLPAQP